MPGAVGQLKKLYQQVIGGVAPGGTASSSGDISQMVKYLIANPPGGIPQQRLWLPGRFSAPQDITLSSGTLAHNFIYARNLTISASQTIQCINNGPTILVVEETLTVGAGAVLHADARGGAGANTGSSGYGGIGGHPHPEMANVLISGYAAHLSLFHGTSSPYAGGRQWPWEGLAVDAPSGSTGGSTSGAAGSNGSAAGSATTVTTPMSRIFRWLNAVSDGLFGAAGGSAAGGGGGGSGASGAFASGGTHYYGGIYGTAGGYTTAPGVGYGGGGGGGIIGTGGGGGGGANAGASGTGGAGGRGGGVIIIVCKTINNAGVIRANGANGAAAVANGGGGGGGGGGYVGVLYEAVSGSGVGTLTANGGSLGAGAGGGGNGGAGGAGAAQSAQIRVS